MCTKQSVPYSTITYSSKGRQTTTMASSLQQGGKNVAQVLEHEKAKLNEVMKNAKNNNLLAGVDVQSSTKATVLCQIRSENVKELKYCIGHDWVGVPMTPIPLSFGVGNDAGFIHQGSKAAVVYGLPSEDPSSPAWLLAWSKLDDLTHHARRVYTRVGTQEKLVSKEIWYEIEKELDQAGDSSQSYDNETGTLIVAVIQDEGDKTASVGASLLCFEGGQAN
ncbi:hypothetical protein vseg_020902 [Gypsophila vaccaria]